MNRVAWLIGLLGCAAVARATESAGQRVYGPASVRGAFLARGMGARPAAMGGAFAAVSDDASAPAWNPAGLGQLSSLSAVAQHELAGEGMAISSLGAALPLGEAVASISVAAISYGTIDYRDETGAPAGEGTLTDGAVTQGWAFRNPAWLGGLGWSGFAVEVVQEARDSALLGVSAGTLIPMDGGVTLGLSVLHLGPSVDGMTLPKAFRIGTAYHTGPVNGVFDLSYGLADHLTDAGAGIEYRPVAAAALRAGWRQEGRGQGIAGSRGVTAGFGVRLARFGLDYAYQPYGDLATTHRISMEYRLPGSPRASRVVMPPPAPEPVTAKPAPAPRRREPTTKVMPDIVGADQDAIPLKPGPVATPAVAVSRTVTAPAPKATPPPAKPVSPVAAPASSATPVEAVPVDDAGPHIDPLLPPPAELDRPVEPEEGLRGGSRRGAARPGAGTDDAAADAPLRRSR